MTLPIQPRRLPHNRAQTLRRTQTPTEKALWRRLRNGQLGAKFRRQFPIGEFIADFACPQARLVIELDGAQHVEQAEQDQWRSRILAQHGYRVLRFWKEEIRTNPAGVLEQIERALRS